MLQEFTSAVLNGPAKVVFPLGSRVEKTKGYKWPGVVVSAFYTKAGKLRYVVECTVPEVEGALHIYAPEQIKLCDS